MIPGKGRGGGPSPIFTFDPEEQCGDIVKLGGRWRRCIRKKDHRGGHTSGDAAWSRVYGIEL